MKKNHLFTGAFSAMLWPTLLAAQATTANNATVAEQKAINIFYSSINDNAGLYNGTEYILFDAHIKGTPYFKDGQQPGSVFYNGTLYNNVPLIYETTTANVVIREFGDGVFINLINEKIGYFTMLGHTFIHLVPDSTNKVISDGFYDRLYNGTTIVYAMRKKTLTEDPHTFEKSFVENTHFFIYKNNVFYPVGGKSAVLNVFKDKKKDLSKFARQNDLSFRKDPEYAIVKIAEYYDKLTH